MYECSEILGKYRRLTPFIELMDYINPNQPRKANGT